MPIPPPPAIEHIMAAFPELNALVHIATGGFKYVYRAGVSGHTEAFKLLALPAAGATECERAARQEYIGRARREISLLAHFTSRELVKLGTVIPREVLIGGISFLGYSEEFLDGESIQSYVHRGGPRPREEDAKRLFGCLLRAIKELWENETVHRDIKPLNVMMTQDTARPFVLLDLGIAYQMREPGLTVNPEVRPATLRYIAPEMLQANFRQSLDYRADIYTAGITTFEFASFRHPLDLHGVDPVGTLTQVLRRPSTPLKLLRPDYSDDFCRLIDQTLKKAPPLRPANIEMMLRRLNSTI
ncbi:MAG TPA: protein kinase [Opitutaceae bacterium]|nr:protein kinase [Opitutaceae bacterium]